MVLRVTDKRLLDTTGRHNPGHERQSDHPERPARRRRDARFCQRSDQGIRYLSRLDVLKAYVRGIEIEYEIPYAEPQRDRLLYKRSAAGQSLQTRGLCRRFSARRGAGLPQRAAGCVKLRRYRRQFSHSPVRKRPGQCLFVRAAEPAGRGRNVCRHLRLLGHPVYILAGVRVAVLSVFGTAHCIVLLVSVFRFAALPFVIVCFVPVRLSRLFLWLVAWLVCAPETLPYCRGYNLHAAIDNGRNALFTAVGAAVICVADRNSDFCTHFRYSYVAFCP